jgi:hypothetical protein
MAAVALVLKVMVRVPPVLVKLPTTVLPLRMLAPLKLMPVVPLPVTPKTSSVLAPPLRSMRSTAPFQLG